jgi:hypothetical protein
MRLSAATMSARRASTVSSDCGIATGMRVFPGGHWNDREAV